MGYDYSIKMSSFGDFWSAYGATGKAEGLIGLPYFEADRVERDRVRRKKKESDCGAVWYNLASNVLPGFFSGQT